MGVVLVTGASSGIGLATARILRERGRDVVGISRRGGEGSATADLSTEDGCALAIERARERGPIEAVIHSAGVGSAEEGPIATLEPRVWRASMALNLDAAFHLIRLAWPDLERSGSGRIVLVASTAATHGAPGYSAYSAAKAGLLGMMLSVAQDGAPVGITCNAVLPGWVRSKMSEQSAQRDAQSAGLTVDEVWAARAASYAAGRVITAEEVGEVIAFLASPESSGVSGEGIRVALGDAW
ncbi:MAG: hypothetical protein RL190_2149 [Actinomycetota bacterium]|jgi:NAD(P)-dependent dehydrogenase (short-subunit alcohol dehydrogenase family)